MSNTRVRLASPARSGNRVYDAYCNLQKLCSSLLHTKGSKRGLLVGHSKRVLIRNATFRVQKSGLERARREGLRNVHAFVRGEVSRNVKLDEVTKSPDAVRLRYNPFIWDTFVRADTGATVTSAAAVAIDGKVMFAIDPK